MRKNLPCRRKSAYRGNLGRFLPLFARASAIKRSAAAAKNGTSDMTRKEVRNELPSESAPAAEGKTAAPISCDTASEASIQPPERGKKSLAAVIAPGESMPANTPHSAANASARRSDGASAAPIYAAAASKAEAQRRKSGISFRFPLTKEYTVPPTPKHSANAAQPIRPPASPPSDAVNAEIHWFMTTSVP